LKQKREDLFKEAENIGDITESKFRDMYEKFRSLKGSDYDWDTKFLQKMRELAIKLGKSDHQPSPTTNVLRVLIDYLVNIRGGFNASENGSEKAIKALEKQLNREDITLEDFDELVNYFDEFKAGQSKALLYVGSGSEEYQERINTIKKNFTERFNKNIGERALAILEGLGVQSAREKFGNIQESRFRELLISKINRTYDDFVRIITEDLLLQQNGRTSPTAFLHDVKESDKKGILNDLNEWLDKQNCIKTIVPEENKSRYNNYINSARKLFEVKAIDSRPADPVVK
jgi:hypothetical protein